MSTLVDRIIKAFKPTLLNWDHDVHPTPVEDFIANVIETAHYHDGTWTHYHCTFEDNLLVLKCGCSKERVDYTLVYNALHDRTSSGSLSAVGLDGLVNEIRAMVRH